MSNNFSKFKVGFRGEKNCNQKTDFEPPSFMGLSRGLQKPIRLPQHYHIERFKEASLYREPLISDSQ